MRQPHAFSDQSPDVDCVAELAVSSHRAQPVQAVCQLEAVVRCPADDKHRHQGDDEAERLALLAASGIAQRPEDADVAVEHDQQREPKPQDNTDQLQAHHPLCGVIREPHHTQERLVLAHSVDRGYVLEGNVHPTQAQAAHPDDGTRNLSMAGVSLPAGADGVNDGQVSVKADAGQKEDATVAVQGEEGTRDLASSQAKHPLVSPLHREQGQGEGEKEVRNGQVEEEGVGEGEGAGAAAL